MNAPETAVVHDGPSREAVVFGLPAHRSDTFAPLALVRSSSLPSYDGRLTFCDDDYALEPDGYLNRDPDTHYFYLSPNP